VRRGCCGGKPTDSGGFDLVTMQRALRFDTRNRWQVADPQAREEYAFAFQR